MFLTLYAHTWAKYETIGSSDVYCDKDATIEENRYPLLYE